MPWVFRTWAAVLSATTAEPDAAEDTGPTNRADQMTVKPPALRGVFTHPEDGAEVLARDRVAGRVRRANRGARVRAAHHLHVV